MKELIKKFEKAGFTVEEEDHYNGNRCWSFSDGFIVGSFGEVGYGSIYLDGKIAADREDCFNKYSQCPLIVPIDYSFEELLKNFRFLSTEEDKRYTDEFEFLDEPRKIPHVIYDSE